MLGEQNMLSRNPGGTDFRAINMRPGSSLPLWTIKALILSLAKSIANDAQLKGIVHPEKKKLCHHLLKSNVLALDALHYLMSHT